MIRINLLGREVEKKARGSAFSFPSLSAGATQAGIGAMLVVVLIGLAAAWWVQSRQLRALYGDLSTAQAERARLQDVADTVEALRATTDRMRSKLDVIVQLKVNQSGPVMLLDQVSRAITDGLWLTRLELEDLDVTIRGSALSDVAVADYVKNLEVSSYFDGVFLRTLGDTGEGLNFQISLRFLPLGGAAPADDSELADSTTELR